MFESLGLSQDSLDLYRLLLQKPELANKANRALLFTELKLPEDEVEARLERLRDMGFLAFRWGDDEYAVDPSLTLARLAAQRQSMIGDLTQELDSDRLRASEFIADYNKFVTQNAVPDVEILDGVDKANLRMQHFHPTVSMWGLNKSKSPLIAPTENFPDKHILERGVECRYLLEESQLKLRGARDYLAYMQEMGGKVRFVPSIPFKLVIFDGESAVMNLDPDDYDAGAVVHHSKAVVRMAIEMYEHYWRYADRSFERRPEASELSGQEAELLRLLVQGLPMSRWLGSLASLCERFAEWRPNSVSRWGLRGGSNWGFGRLSGGGWISPSPRLGGGANCCAGRPRRSS
ncbi:TrmB family transcriptional regulator [Kribbella sp. NPDC056951]|uniref:TrmB family transcriptional regulator n=1 Tax=Kribbella sp. NPDC056951 TaxID=3345978 RepID=UPI003633D40A